MLLRLSLVVAAASAAVHAAESAAPVVSTPRLAVVISIDQFRADYLVRFRPYFGDGGFKRLLEGGANFQNCHHRHSITQTAPGHASILTGVFANTHGITSNEWVNRSTWETVNSVEDADSPLVGISPAELGPLAMANPRKTGRSPRPLHALTVGDQLKAKYGNRSVVFAASNKDRSAILLGGQRADAAYWDENGRIVTSNYYRATLPAWVEAFNAEKRVHATFGRTWDRLRDTAIYDAVQGPDDAVGEADGSGLGRTFPRTITGGKATIAPAFFTAFDNSPFSAEFLGEFVQRAIREEKLGRHEGPDLLCMSFSQIDVAGHNFGPDSHEIMDSVLRIDRVLAQILDCIDREVGLARCVFVLTADHGACPLPERLLAKEPGLAAGRVKTADLDAAIRKALNETFGPLSGKEYWFLRDNAGYHLRPTALAAKQVSAADAAKVAKAALATFPFIAEVYTRDELLAMDATGDSLPAKMRRSYRGAEDRDVVYVTKPYYLVKANSGTSHGTPYEYDTHVPQLWYGAGVPRKTSTEPVGVEDIAPTLSAILGVPAPPATKGKKLF